MRDDDAIRQQFAALRRADAASTPSFGEVSGSVRARRTPRATVWRSAVAACGVLAMALIVAVRSAYPPPRSAAVRVSAPMLADWRAPTDFLLETPGRELLHTIPDFGPDPSTELRPLPPTLMTTPAPRAGQEHS